MTWLGEIGKIYRDSVKNLRENMNLRPKFFVCVSILDSATDLSGCSQPGTPQQWVLLEDTGVRNMHEIVILGLSVVCFVTDGGNLLTRNCIKFGLEHYELYIDFLKYIKTTLSISWPVQSHLSSRQIHLSTPCQLLHAKTYRLQKFVDLF